MIDSGLVLACNVEQCSWWRNRECHAMNISVGDMHPTCDRYTTAAVDQQDSELPQVDNCLVQQCKYNDANGCVAPGITVGHHAEHADCETFVPLG